MTLTQLLASTSDEDLARLSKEHVRTDELVSRAQLSHMLESAVRSYSFVHDFVTNRQPPTFAMLSLLLDSPNHTLPFSGFYEKAMGETMRLAALVTSGEVLSRDNQLQLYRRSLYEARRSDLDLNGSEAALLAVLRRETSIAQVEHFLIEHHEDLQEFWLRSDAAAHELTALSSAGVLFLHDSQVVLPEELAPFVAHALGIDMPVEGLRRLLACLSSADLAKVLDGQRSQVSGTKDARLERIVVERIQARTVLRALDLAALRELARDNGARVSGAKDDLVERIVAHFAQGRDQYEEDEPPPRATELHLLERNAFDTLFGCLTHQELSEILRAFEELRQSGTKNTRLETLWEAELSEHTLLSRMMNRDLENILNRLGLRLSGSKLDRIERIVSHFAVTPVSHVGGIGEVQSDTVAADAREATAEQRARQEVFKQKASNPQGALQPWLEELFHAQGRVRCYATEDVSPTKQLKNKLAQAAAARDGMLLLLLTDGDSCEKAREALVERWLTNDEWSKSVACVALAFPIGSPSVSAVVERGETDLSARVLELLFPNASVIRAEGVAELRCHACRAVALPEARFCSHCGAARQS